MECNQLSTSLRPTAFPLYPPRPAHRAYTLLCPPARERASARSTGPGRGLPSPGTNVACQPERGFQTQSAHGAGGRPGSRRWARWRPGGPGTVSSGHGRNWARWRGVGGLVEGMKEPSAGGNHLPPTRASAANRNFEEG